jgi:hypothetical protein
LQNLLEGGENYFLITNELVSFHRFITPNDVGKRDFSFNASFHSSTLVQVIGNKSADLGLLFFSNKIW